MKQMQTKIKIKIKGISQIFEVIIKYHNLLHNKKNASDDQKTSLFCKEKKKQKKVATKITRI